MKERFKVKFVNGFWVSFDTVNFENTQVYFLKRDAVVAVKAINKEVK